MTGPQPVDTEGIASTPGVVGYVLAVGISWVLASLSSWLLVVRALGLLLDWSMLLALFAVLSAPFGVLAVHLLCERFDPQWIHVVAAGLVGALAVLSASQLLVGELAWRMAVGIGVTTALGRAVVVPLVPVVRLRCPAGTPVWRRFILR